MLRIQTGGWVFLPESVRWREEVLASVMDPFLFPCPLWIFDLRPLR